MPDSPPWSRRPARPLRSGAERRLNVPSRGVLEDLHAEALLVVGSVPGRGVLADAVGEIPIVVAAADAEGLRCDVVRNDDHLGMRLVVDYLVACGHRAIAHLGGVGGGTARERLAGYRAAMEHHGLATEIVVVRRRLHRGCGVSRNCPASAPRPAGHGDHGRDDLAAVGALSAAADAGLRVPDDLALTGYDDILRRRDPTGVAHRAQPRQLRHRLAGRTLSAEPDRGAGAEARRAPPGSTAGHPVQLRRTADNARAVFKLCGSLRRSRCGSPAKRAAERLSRTGSSKTESMSNVSTWTQCSCGWPDVLTVAPPSTSYRSFADPESGLTTLRLRVVPGDGGEVERAVNAPGAVGGDLCYRRRSQRRGMVSTRRLSTQPCRTWDAGVFLAPDPGRPFYGAGLSDGAGWF